MRIQLLWAQLVEDVHHDAGEVIEVAERIGRLLIGAGSAVRESAPPAATAAAPEPKPKPVPEPEASEKTAKATTSTQAKSRAQE